MCVLLLLLFCCPRFLILSFDEITHWTARSYFGVWKEKKRKIPFGLMVWWFCLILMGRRWTIEKYNPSAHRVKRPEYLVTSITRRRRLKRPNFPVSNNIITSTKKHEIYFCTCPFTARSQKKKKTKMIWWVWLLPEATHLCVYSTITAPNKRQSSSLVKCFLFFLLNCNDNTNIFYNVELNKWHTCAAFPPAWKKKTIQGGNIIIIRKRRRSKVISIEMVIIKRNTSDDVACNNPTR